MSDPFSSYPRRFKARTATPVLWYRRVADRFAVQGGISEACRDRLVSELERDEVAVCRGEAADLPEGAAEGATLSPVYALEGGGPAAVPTGLVLVRFAEHVAAESQREALRGAGYMIHRVVPHAPHAVWVEALSGRIADALTTLSGLERLEDVENIEPQLLTERGLRGAA